MKILLGTICTAGVTKHSNLEQLVDTLEVLTVLQSHRHGPIASKFAIS
jgi:hypothetical protein